MPNVLHITLASDAGGLSRYILDLSAATARHGWTSIVAGDVGVWQSKFEEAGLRYVRLPLRNATGSLFWLRRQLTEQLGDTNIDLIHTHYRRATLLGRGLQKRHRPSMLYTLHLSHLDVSGWRRLFSDFGDHTLCASRDAQHWLEDEARVRPDRISFIPHGIDLTRWTPTDEASRAQARRVLNIDPDALVVAFVGRLDDPKNPHWVLDAHHAIAQERHDRPDATRPGKIVSLLVGDGPQRETLERQIAQQSIDARLLGETEPLDAYRAADLLLLPSWREGFSYVTAEAMATGLPVLRTRTSGTSETIVEGVTGMSCPIDHDAFVNAALELSRDPLRLRTMGQSACRHARSTFDFDRQVRSTLDLYTRLSKP